MISFTVFSLKDKLTQKHVHLSDWLSLRFPYQCPGGTFTPGLKSTKEFSDEAVNFIRAHPLMYHPVYPIHKRPLVVRSGVDYRFTTIAVDQVDAVDGRYEVLFLGTGESGIFWMLTLVKFLSQSVQLGGV